MAHCSHAPSRALAIRASALITGLLLAAVANAQPSVRVRAGTQLELEAVSTDRGVTLQGALKDDLGVPLAGRTVELQVETEGGAKQQRARQTADDGTFHAAIGLAPAHYRALVRFAGDTAYTAVEQRRELDAGKLDVQLRFIEPRTLRLDLDQPSHPIAVRASASTGAADLELSVEDDRGRQLLHGRSGEDGSLRAELPSSAFGTAGIGRLIARTPGDARRSASQNEIEVLRFERSALTLRARIDEAHAQLVLDGRLRTARRDLAGEAIGLFDGAQHIATLRSAADGSFRFAGGIPQRPSTGANTLRVQARFDSDSPWIGASRSRTIELRLPISTAPSVVWLFAPLLACALALWLSSRRELQGLRQLAPTAERGAGVHLAARGARGRAEQHTLSGSVRDAASDLPIGGALLTLQPAHGAPTELVSDAAGVFAAYELPAGAFALHVQAAGYAALESALTVPHRGEWSDVQVLLTSLRVAAVAAYRPVAARALPAPELWERWTARETLESATRAGRAPESFVALTERVERAAYAKSPPNAADLATIERFADAALAEMPAPTATDHESHSRNSAPLRARIPHHR